MILKTPPKNLGTIIKYREVIGYKINAGIFLRTSGDWCVGRINWDTKRRLSPKSKWVPYQVKPNRLLGAYLEIKSICFHVLYIPSYGRGG